jgi:membrane protein
VRRELLRVPGALQVARLTVETIRVCLRYRVTGLASEAGFFMLLSLPPLVLGLFGGVGYIGKWLGPETVTKITNGIQDWAANFLTTEIVDRIVLPTTQDVLKDGRFDLISVGFLLSIWSGSRALNVFVDTISIMYGQSGERGIVRTRALSLTLYFLSLLVGIVVIPLVVIGPTWLKDLLPRDFDVLALLYWPVVTVLAVVSITSLFHISTPRRSPWLRDVPGGILTLVIWVVASFILRGTVSASVTTQSTSIYGPLATPIVLLIFLYFLAIAVLIGAALNAAVRHLWPVEEQPSLRARTVAWVKERVAERRGEPETGHEDERVPEAGEGLAASVKRARKEAGKPLTPMPPSAPEGPDSQRPDGTQPASSRSRRADLERASKIG